MANDSDQNKNSPVRKPYQARTNAADRLLYESIESGPLPPTPPKPKPVEPAPKAEPQINNAPPRGTPEWARDKEARKPNIRTMKTDAQELIATSKPSFSNMVAQEVAESQRRQRDEPIKTAPQKTIWLRISAVVALIFVLTGASFYLFSFRRVAQEEAERIIAAGSFFSTEHTLGIAASSSDPAAFKERLGVLQNVRDREGTHTNVSITHYGTGAPSGKPITFDDILLLLSARPPLPLGTPTGERAMVFLLHGKTGASLGIATKIGEPDRTFGALLAWERRSLAKDLSALLPQDARGKPLSEPQDRTYRNIDWRAAIAIPGESEIGIHYGVFGAKNLLLITTSKPAMERAIDRLYETR